MKKAFFLLLFLLVHGASGAEFYNRHERVGTDFADPKSIIFDSKKEVYYVSNMNGGLEDKNNTGYISVLKKGKKKYYNEILFKGGENGIQLNSPKGMVIVARKLYVADIDVLRVFDLKTSKQLADIAIPTSTLLYELIVNKQKTIFVTDMENNCVYGRHYPYKNQPTFYKVNEKGLANPSGLAYQDENHFMWVASYDADKLLKVSKVKNRRKFQPYRLRTKGIDGITCLGGKGNVKFFMTAQPDNKVYLVTINTKMVIRKAINRTELKGPSGLCYNPLNKLLFVTEKDGNAVSIFEVSDTDLGAADIIKGGKQKRKGSKK